MKPDSFHQRLLAQNAPLWTLPFRTVLAVIEPLYAAAVRARNRMYERPGTTIRVPLPVISVGNLTAGGTGKTPLVIEIVKRLNRWGRSPAVVARGYKSRPGRPNDEELLIRRHCGNIIYIANPDRAAAAFQARERGADVLVLDDAFQHRRLARNLDLVCIDATCPFGHDRLIPRGLLREPLEGLRRAHAAVLTRCDQVDDAALTQIERRIRAYLPQAPILRSRHRIIAVDYVNQTPVEGALEGGLRGKRAVVFAAIARPAAFVETVKSLGVNIVGTKWWPDHHHYWQKDIHDVVVPGRMPKFDVVLTTEKDAVKLEHVPGYDPAFIMVVKVAVDFPPSDSTMLDCLLKSTLDRSAPA